jgi:hypothetical protein
MFCKFDAKAILLERTAGIQAGRHDDATHERDHVRIRTSRVRNSSPHPGVWLAHCRERNHDDDASRPDGFGGTTFADYP